MKKKILLVDDEPRIAQLLSMRLEAIGYEVFIAHDGVDCVQIALREVPDLILMDIKMPYRDGIGAFEQLIQLDMTRSIPVIFMTAFPTIELKKLALKMGANGFIAKPFTSKEIEQTITMTLENYDRF
ncbi:response regulator [bacterium]|nr:response regulator [bacterium]